MVNNFLTYDLSKSRKKKEISEKPTFLSLPRKRESRKVMKLLDSPHQVRGRLCWSLPLRKQGQELQDYIPKDFFRDLRKLKITERCFVGGSQRDVDRLFFRLNFLFEVVYPIISIGALNGQIL